MRYKVRSRMLLCRLPSGGRHSMARFLYARSTLKLSYFETLPAPPSDHFACLNTENLIVRPRCSALICSCCPLPCCAVCSPVSHRVCSFLCCQTNLRSSRLVSCRHPVFLLPRAPAFRKQHARRGARASAARRGSSATALRLGAERKTKPKPKPKPKPKTKPKREPDVRRDVREGS